jgi:pyruvate/2-oxoglutarate/acetoin dehydrogenase E1 component
VINKTALNTRMVVHTTMAESIKLLATHSSVLLVCVLHCSGWCVLQQPACTQYGSLTLAQPQQCSHHAP